jgi:NADH:ubiquinone oxidoreductase subunit 2 (subunit N)
MPWPWSRPDHDLGNFAAIMQTNLKRMLAYTRSPTPGNLMAVAAAGIDGRNQGVPGGADVLLTSAFTTGGVRDLIRFSSASTGRASAWTICAVSRAAALAGPADGLLHAQLTASR